MPKRKKWKWCWCIILLAAACNRFIKLFLLACPWKTPQTKTDYCVRGNPILHERISSLKSENAYSEVKTIMLEKGCKIVSEEPPKHILIRHGSLWGISPKYAKKIVSYRIFPHKSGTKIVSYSSTSPDWANLTLWGNIIAGVLAAVLWWIASDVSDYLAGGKLGDWTWLARAFGYPNAQHTFFMINVTKALSLVLVITILLEILDVFIVYRKIDSFAEETLDELTKKHFW
jgi:hypothetical protein